MPLRRRGRSEKSVRVSPWRGLCLARAFASGDDERSASRRCKRQTCSTVFCKGCAVAGLAADVSDKLGSGKLMRCFLFFPDRMPIDSGEAMTVSGSYSPPSRERRGSSIDGVLVQLLRSPAATALYLREKLSPGSPPQQPTPWDIRSGARKERRKGEKRQPWQRCRRMHISRPIRVPPRSCRNCGRTPPTRERSRH